MLAARNKSETDSPCSTVIFDMFAVSAWVPGWFVFMTPKLGDNALRPFWSVWSCIVFGPPKRQTTNKSDGFLTVSVWGALEGTFCRVHVGLAP